MHDPTIADFPLGTRFDVDAGGGSIALTVSQAQPLPGGMRAGGGFRIEFIGPQAPVMPQSIYRFVRGRTQMEIFIVPLGITPDGVRYEAIYF